jgi:hypothetical protein
MSKSKSLVLLALLIIPLFLAVLPVKAQTPPAITSPNIWASGINYIDGGLISDQDSLAKPNCENKLVRARKTRGPLETLANGQLTHAQGNEYLSEPFTQCITYNQHGAFSNDYYAPDSDTNNMMRIAQSRNGNQFFAAPIASSVLTVTRQGSLAGDYMALNYNFQDGKTTYSRSGTTDYDIDWTPTNLNPAFQYVDNSVVLTNKQQFSSNGKHMVARFDNYFAKVDLATQQMTPFYFRAPVTLASLHMAISNDGRYVVTIMNGEFRIHDTSTCIASYAKGEWQKYTASVIPAGCTTGASLSSAISSASSGHSLFYTPMFSPNGAEITTFADKFVTGAPVQHKKVILNSTNYVSSARGYLAMGDSFSSGEGDTEGNTWYEPGTDEQGNKDTFEGRNLCHLSRRSYPYLIAKELAYLSGAVDQPTTPAPDGLFHSVACSGAKIQNIRGGASNGTVDYPANESIFADANNQYRNDFLGSLGAWQPGRIKQLDFLSSEDLVSPRAPMSPEVITIGVGGNDANFGDIIKACTLDSFLDIAGTCKQAVRGSIDAGNVARNIARLKPKLVKTYSAIKSTNPDTRVYVHGYPIFIKGYNGNCGNNVRLNAEETAMAEEGVKYMNTVVASAAKEAGVGYIDVTNILDSTNLCSQVPDNQKTVNGIKEGNDKGGLNAEWVSLLFSGVTRTCILSSGCFGNESYHPNQLAQSPYKQAILIQTNNLTTPMPEPEKTPYPIPDAFFGTQIRELLNQLNQNDGFFPSNIVIEEPGRFLSYGPRVDSLKINQTALPGSKLKAVGESTPTEIGEYTVPDNGVFELDLDIPEFMKNDPGIHEIHLLGTNKFGQQFDVYEQIVVGKDLNDFDGDGINNQTDKCLTIKNSNLDVDRDGLDDACDPEVIPYVEPPPPPPPPVDPPAPTKPTLFQKIASLIKKIIKTLFVLFAR